LAKMATRNEKKRQKAEKKMLAKVNGNNKFKDKKVQKKKHKLGKRSKKNKSDATISKHADNKTGAIGHAGIDTKSVKSKPEKTSKTAIENSNSSEVTSNERKKVGESKPCLSSMLGSGFSIKGGTLQQKMVAKLKAAHFRYINEKLYSVSGHEAMEFFQNEPHLFDLYHTGYSNQLNQWKYKPLDRIIERIKSLPKTAVIADMGCGDARLARTVEQKVHSFDLKAINDRVVECDMSRTPLSKSSVDVVVFCLSLMGTNIVDFVLEANRILRNGGIMEIAEVTSRFENWENFIKALYKFGFQNTDKDLKHKLFVAMSFRKISSVEKSRDLPRLQLLPCLYKKR